MALSASINTPLRVLGIQSKATSSSTSSNEIATLFSSKVSFLEAGALPDGVRILSLQPKGDDQSDSGGSDERVILRLANIAATTPEVARVDIGKMFRIHALSEVYESALTLLQTTQAPISSSVIELGPMVIRTLDRKSVV